MKREDMKRLECMVCLLADSGNIIILCILRYRTYFCSGHFVF